MNRTYSNGGALALGIVALALESIAFWAFGWLSIIALILGIVGCCLYTSNKGWKVPAIISIPLGAIDIIFWVIGFAIAAGR